MKMGVNITLSTVKLKKNIFFFSQCLKNVLLIYFPSAAERSFQEFLQPHNRTSEATTSKISTDTARSSEISRLSTSVNPTDRQSINDSAVPFSQPTLQFDGVIPQSFNNYGNYYLFFIFILFLVKF